LADGSILDVFALAPNIPRRRMKIPFIPSGIPNLEPAAWLGMRISGLVLFLMAGWYAIHIDVLTGLDHVNSSWLAVRWANPLWQVFDILFVFLVTIHGLNGTRRILFDSIHLHPLRRVVLIFLLLVGGIFIFLSGIAIFSTG